MSQQYEQGREVAEGVQPNNALLPKVESGLTVLTPSGLLDPVSGRIVSKRELSHPTTGLSLRSGQILIVEDGVRITDFETGEEIARAPALVTDLLETERGRILVAMNQGKLGHLTERGVEINQSFQSLETRALWHTPWDPSDVDIHSLRQLPNGTIFASVHVGGFTLSTDGGETWKQSRSGFERLVVDKQGVHSVTPGLGLNPDVHDFAIHPLEPETFLVPTRDGAYVSEDGGHSFTPRNNGIAPLLEDGMNYQRSAAIFAERDVWLVSQASGPGIGTDSRIFRSINRGEDWLETQGIPSETRGQIDTIRVLGGSKAIALVGDELFLSADYGESWQKTDYQGAAFFTHGKHHVIRPIVKSS